MIKDWAREDGISGFDIECDECGQSTFYDRDEFQAFIAGARSDGWKIYMEDGDWTHLCRDCAAKENA